MNFDEVRIRQVIMNLLSNAIKNKSLLNIEYCNIEGISSKRQIEPYGLKMKSGRWYLNAYCLNRNEFRVFKVNRIVGLEITQQHFIEKTARNLKYPRVVNHSQVTN